MQPSAWAGTGIQPRPDQAHPVHCPLGPGVSFHFEGRAPALTPSFSGNLVSRGASAHQQGAVPGLEVFIHVLSCVCLACVEHTWIPGPLPTGEVAVLLFVWS